MRPPIMDQSQTTGALAAFAANVDSARLPAEVRQKLGWLLLDYLRVCSIGARLPWSDWARGYAEIIAKPGASRVLFSAEALNPQHATFLNVAFGSSFDGDDTHVGAMLHPGVAAWAAALAVAEHAGSRAPDVLAAVVAGYETTIRIGLAIQPGHFRRGFQSTGTCDVFGTAAAPPRPPFPGPHARLPPAPWPARRRFSGPPDIIEGAGGFARAYADEWNPSIVVDGLGERFHLMDVLVKSHAAAARVAAGIDAMLALRREPRFG